MPARPIEDVLKTIDRRSEKRGDCTVWTGMVNVNKGSQGYGSIRCHGKMRLVHRIVYEHRVGPITDGLYVLHKCDNRRCCKPEHLFLGTNDDNMADKCAKDRSGKKLSIQKVRDIRKLCSLGHTQREVAAMYGVKPGTISNAVTGARWAHVS